MVRTFENPGNGYREQVDGTSILAIIFFGALYLVYKGLWRHVFIWVLVVGVPAVASGGPLLLLSLPIATIAYACGIQGILEGNYLRMGWKDISESESPTTWDNRGNPLPDFDAERPWLTYDGNYSNSSPSSPAKIPSRTHKKCPFCAEEIKYEAIKCKHCQSELPPPQKSENEPDVVHDRQGARVLR